MKNSQIMQKKIPLAIPSLLGNEKKYLNECIDTGFVSSVGPFVDKFESMLVKKTGSKYVVSVSSGTCALHLSLVATGVNYGDLVLIPDFTFIATANAVSHCGASPWLIDVSLKDWGMDVDILDEVLSKKTYLKEGTLYHLETHQRIAAIIAVYALGLPCYMQRLELIAEKFNLPLIVDAAAGIGSVYHSKPLGLHGGNLITLSFNGNKNITSGGGGAILTNDEVVARKIRHLSTTARIGPDYDHDEIGYNYRMTNIEAAIGCAQLEQLDQFMARKKYSQEFYKNNFKDISEIFYFPVVDERVSSYWLAGIVLRNTNIHSLITWLRADGIEAKLFWKPIHLQKPYQKCLKTETKNSDFIWDKILILPCSSTITDAELLRVSQRVLKFFKDKKYDE